MGDDDPRTARVLVAEHGSVSVSEQVATPTGWWSLFMGRVSILRDVDTIGFETTGRESNWIARIEGPSGQAWNIPGCRVVAIAESVPPKASGLGYVVP